MTNQQAATICKALQYIITELVSKPKTTAAKQKRAELLQALTNAGRPPKESTRAEPTIGGESSQSTPDAPGTFKLETSMIMPPDGEDVPIVRPGTVAGIPIGGSADDVEN